MKVLVVGGAGYIGSHMVQLLRERGHEVGTRQSFDRPSRGGARRGRCSQATSPIARLVARLLARARFDAVMHFAALIQVGESVREPGSTTATTSPTRSTCSRRWSRHGVLRFIFSSTAAVYGEPARCPSTRRIRAPINPYGASKLMVEQHARRFRRAYGLARVAALLQRRRRRSGRPSSASGTIRRRTSSRCVLQAASATRPVKVFGRDYDTPDGTCVRDYIHVVDLCQAHLLALESLGAGAQSGAFNLGNGNGFSVRR